jgi:hypothetical protein
MVLLGFIRRTPGTKTRGKHHVIPWIDDPMKGAGTGDHMVFHQRHEADTIELFFDLFFVANLATFTACEFSVVSSCTFANTDMSHKTMPSSTSAPWLRTLDFSPSFGAPGSKSLYTMFDLPATPSLSVSARCSR